MRAQNSGTKASGDCYYVTHTCQPSCLLHDVLSCKVYSIYVLCSLLLATLHDVVMTNQGFCYLDVKSTLIININKLKHDAGHKN